MKLTKKEIKEKFIELLGKEYLQYLKDNNWIKFSNYHISDWNCNIIQICFFTTDNKGDNVIHFSIGYDMENKKWFSENCIDDPEIEYDSFNDMKNHMNDISDRIIDNGFDLPNL